MIKNNEKYASLGNVKIFGPTTSEKRCGIFLDLAEAFGFEYTKDAVSKLRDEWKKLGIKARLDIDSEADAVSIFVSKNSVVDVALLINKNSTENFILNNELIESTRKEIKKWKAPEPFPWKVGDVFYISLSGNLTAYGQVLGKNLNSPTCALLDYFSEKPCDDYIEALKTRVLAILHVSANHLDNQNWVVIGNSQPIANPGSGPCGERNKVGSISWDGLEKLAKSWGLIEPWNDFYKDDYLDEFLLPGVSRPKGAIILAGAELEKRGIKRPEWQ